MTTEEPPSPPAPEASPVKRRRLRLIIALILVNLLVLALILWLRAPVIEVIEAEVVQGAAAAITEEATQDEAVVPVLVPVPVPDEGEPLPRLTFLVMGSDTRENLPDELGVNDRVPGRRADVVMIVIVDGDEVRVLSLPRDLKVEIEGYGTKKLNAAYAFGGSALMVSTVSELIGVDIHHYVELDFYGFARIVDELGGVEISFPYPARDLKSFLDVDAGRQRLDGAEALAYARSRQYQELRGGTWVTVDGSDLGRIRRQQSLLFAMLESAKRPSIIFDAADVLRATGSHITIDKNLDQERLAELLLVARRLDRQDVEVVTLPTIESREGGAYYLAPLEPEAGATIAAFLGADTDPGGGVATESIRLRVLNGNGGNGQATAWADRLGIEGFDVAGVGDAASFDFDDTVVTVRPGDIGKGSEIVDTLGFGRVEAGSVADGLDAVVIMGADALAREVVAG